VFTSKAVCSLVKILCLIMLWDQAINNDQRLYLSLKKLMGIKISLYRYFLLVFFPSRNKAIVFQCLAI